MITLCSHTFYFGPKRALYIGFQRRNEMLGLGLLGTVIVIMAIVWLVRRA